MLADTVAAQLKEAMVARDELRVSTLRMLQAALQNREITERGKGSASPLTDAQVTAVVRAELKKRRDAIEAYRAAGRVDAAAREEAEAGVLAVLLPPELSDAELDALVAEGVLATGAASERDFGKLMGWLRGRVDGKASGERVAAAAKRKLGVA
ncbi:GatB/YqeY domain-containing protein [Candidatus Parcubacteria bacterium]|nr:MAG: GatB/YqeY domain-containing protein [Candidatus Parcubacteria bacterium]